MASKERRIESASAIILPPYVPLQSQEELVLISDDYVLASFLAGLTETATEDFDMASVDASALGDVSLDFVSDFMFPIDELLPDLELVMANAGAFASVMFEHFGGDDFAEALEQISVIGGTGAMLEILNRAEYDDDEGYNTGEAGDDFMAALEQIIVDGGNGQTTVDIVNEGGRDFMEELTIIDVMAIDNVSVKVDADFYGSFSTDPAEPLNSKDFMASLETIEVVSETGHADLSISHDGASGFMEDLESIFIRGAFENTEDEYSGYRGARLSISASANDHGGSGANFMESLQTIEVIGTEGEVDVSISHSGGDNFMESLTELTVYASGFVPEDEYSYDGVRGNVEVSISASANTYHSNADPAELIGTNFMQALETISVVSEHTSVSLSISHSGGANFMESLTSIRVEAVSGNGLSEASAELSISASADFYNAYTYDYDAGEEIALSGVSPEDFRGNNFMESLESIEVIAADRNASLSISHSGGDDFMQNLKTLFVEARGLNDGDGSDNFYGRAEISISASANYNDPISSDDQPGTQLRGNGFMESLESIQILSAAEARASLSISHSGGNDMMTDLETIQVRNTYDGEVSYFTGSGSYEYFDYSNPDAVVDISASLNFSGAEGNNFMESLDSIEVESEVGTATLSISVDGNDDFMSDLTMLNVEGFAGASATIRQGMPDEIYDRDEDEYRPSSSDVTGSDFMGSLQTINVMSEVGRAALDIDHSGGDGFMESLTDINVHGGMETQVEIHNETSNGFMEGLTMIDIMGSDGFFYDHPVFLFDESHGYGFSPDDEFPAIIPVDFLDIINNAGGGKEDFDIKFIEEEGPGLRQSGSDFMESLETISMQSGFSGEINLLNGFDGYEFLDEGPEEFVAFDLGFPGGPGGFFFDGPGSLGDELLSDLFFEAALFGEFFFEGDEKPGGNDFMQSLETVDLMTGLDGDVALVSFGNRSFESLTEVNIDSNLNPEFSGGPVPAVAFDGPGVPIGGPFFPFDEYELIDLFSSELSMIGVDDEDAFASLEAINIDATGGFFREPDLIGAKEPGPVALIEGFDGPGGPWGGFGPGTIVAELQGIQSEEFDVNLTTVFGGNIVLAASDTAGMTSINLTGDNLAEVTLFGDQSGLELIDLSDMSYYSYSVISLGLDHFFEEPEVSLVLFDEGDDEEEEPISTFGDEIDILVGDGTILFAAIGGSQENFVIPGGSETDLGIFNFEAGDDGDVLDFSDLGIDGDDLMIVDDGPGGVEISGTEGSGFYGSVQLVGVDFLDLSDDNFLF
jgi:hypothetical protein